MSYTKEQIDIAFGIFSGRINPISDLAYFDEAQKLHGNLVGTINGGSGNPGPMGHRLKAEEIIRSLIQSMEADK